MLHPEERQVTQTAGTKSSLLMAVLLFVAIAAIAALGYMKSEGIELKNIDIRQLLKGNDDVRVLNETSGITEISYDAKEHPVFGIHMDYIVKCTADGIWLLDRKGREQWSVGVSLANPLVKSNGRDLLVADIGGRDVHVISGKSVKWKSKTEENIQNAEISEDGYVTVLTASKLYNGEIKVYDSHGIELFQSIIANDFAVTAKIAPSGKFMATNLINASDAKSFSYMKFQGINDSEPKKVDMPASSGIYPFVWFSGDDSIFAAGDTSILCMDKNGEIQWDKQFYKVGSACVSGSKRLAAAVKNENKYELKVFTTAGQEYSSVELDGEVRSISSPGGIIAVNTGMSAAFFTEKGTNKGVYNARDEIIQVLFFNKQQAAVITKSYIAIMDI